MALDLNIKSKMEARLAELKKVQSDYFKVKKAERQANGLDDARNEMSRLKKILTQANRGREIAAEDLDYVKANFS